MHRRNQPHFPGEIAERAHHQNQRDHQQHRDDDAMAPTQQSGDAVACAIAEAGDAIIPLSLQARYAPLKKKKGPAVVARPEGASEANLSTAEAVVQTDANQAEVLRVRVLNLGDIHIFGFRAPVGREAIFDAGAKGETSRNRA